MELRIPAGDRWAGTPVLTYMRVRKGPLGGLKSRGSRTHFLSPPRSRRELRGGSCPVGGLSSEGSWQDPVRLQGPVFGPRASVAPQSHKRPCVHFGNTPGLQGKSLKS